MTDKVEVKKVSESDDYTDLSMELTANDSAAKEQNAAGNNSNNVESEYDTASDSPSDNNEEENEGEEEEDYENESSESESGEEITDDDEEGSDGSDDDVIEILDNERQSGDGQEQDLENKRKVDDDEDRSNPQYIPKKGTFYEHDDRTAEDLDADVKNQSEEGKNVDDQQSSVGSKTDKIAPVKPTKKWQVSADRWTHDRFDEGEQAPKSRAELVSAYGYDIRSEDGPPRARRRRRYARGPNKYTRNWEDEDAYNKTSEHQRLQRKNPKQSMPGPEDFPELEMANKHEKRPQRRLSSRNSNRNERNRGSDYDRERERDHGERRDRERDRDDYRQKDDHQDYHDEPKSYRDRGDRYSNAGNAVGNYNNKENKSLSGRSSAGKDKDRDRRSNDYKVINTLQFKNQNRNKGLENSSSSGNISGTSQMHSNALSSSSSNKINQIERSNSGYNYQISQNQMQNPREQVQIIHHQQQQNYPGEMPGPNEIHHHHHQFETMNFTNSKTSKDRYAIVNSQMEMPGQMDVNYQQQQQRSAKEKERLIQQQQQQSNVVTSVVAVAQRSQISPRQIISTTQSTISPTIVSQLSSPHMPEPQIQQPAQQIQRQYVNTTIQQQQQQQQVQQAQLQQIHSSHIPPNTMATPTQQPQILTDASSRSSKRYSSLRQRSTLDSPTVVDQQQLLQSQSQKQTYQIQQPIAIQSEYIQQKPQQAQSQAATVPSVQFQHAYYATTAPSGVDYVSTAPAPQQVQVQQPTVAATVVQQPNQIYSSHQYIQAPPPTYLQTPAPAPPPQPQAAPAAAPPQILNYVPSITAPAATAQYQAPYPGYQNYNAVVPQAVAQPVPVAQPAATAAALYQSQSGITYYAPQTQPQPQRTLTSQRRYHFSSRPTSAIPILAPPDRKNKSKDDDDQQSQMNSMGNAPIGSAENIDHILDNMFVQRPPYQPPRKSPSPVPSPKPAKSAESATSTSVMVANELDKVGDTVKKLTIQEEIIQTPQLADEQNSTLLIETVSNIADPTTTQ